MTRTLRFASVALLLVLSGCGGLSRSESATLATGVETYVNLVPKRDSMTPDEREMHDRLGRQCVYSLKIAGGIAPIHTGESAGGSSNVAH